MFKKLFAGSWEPRVAAIVVTIAGIPLAASEIGLVLPTIVLSGCKIAAIVAAVFGFSKAKSVNSTTSVDGANVRVTK